MFYEPDKRNHGLGGDPFKAIVAPRPIGWITSMDAKGNVNLAPYSFFNGVHSRPAMVMFASEGRKDSVSNIAETGEFVCNLATWDLREAMNATSAPFQHGVNEMERAGLKAAPSKLVKPPRVAASPCALECKLVQIVSIDEAAWRAGDLPDRDRPRARRPCRRALHRRRPPRHRRFEADRALRLRPICRGREPVRDDPARRLTR